MVTYDSLLHMIGILEGVTTSMLGKLDGMKRIQMGTYCQLLQLI